MPRRAFTLVFGAVCALGLAGCAPERGELVIALDPAPSQPEITAEPTEATRAALSRAGALPEGACATQDDCAADELCVAVSPSLAECVAKADVPELQAPPRGPRGQPAPPLGLIDGQAMRDHAARSAP